MISPRLAVIGQCVRGVDGFQVSGARCQVWILAVVLLAGCGKAPEKVASGAEPSKLSVYTVNYPLEYFAERIGGDLVEVVFPGLSDEDPAYWSPNADGIIAYQSADVILLNGADYAKWVSKVSLPSAKLVDTSAAFQDSLIRIKAESTHTHGPEGKHVHGRLAFTTWLDMTLAVEQARAVKDSLSAKLPDSRLILAERFAALEKDLMEIDKQLRNSVQAAKKLPIVFSHPVYQYLERRYAINGMSVHWEPNEEPTEEMLAELEELLIEHEAKWMVWEGSPDVANVLGLKKLGLESIIFDPCATEPSEGDFLSVMRNNVRELQRLSASN